MGMEVHFNNEDNSYYEVFELMAAFAREVTQEALSIEQQRDANTLH